ncbi:uncharacterized protein LOC115686794 [Syzygium oleosum]|uniref:uncharacterized protein LOC115686794 n=1 Tax=Syzygium oleosum TaxID=219896 RepID=UPI0024BB7A24|nr:uncharacterized protein LOC115686794 [Syzygium oleosum]XP_056164594.1 uncharacterized protein LOC115686794 [Syzygium oleosum]
MEARVSGCPSAELVVSLPCSSSLRTPSSHPPRFCLKSWAGYQKSFRKHFRGLAGTWSFHVRKILKCQDFAEVFSVHVVEEGETLSSISKQYGIPIHTITTLNKSIVDLDLVYEGQVLKIPLSKRCTEKTEKKKLLEFDLQQKQWKTSKMLDRFSKKRNFTVLISHQLPYAKTTGYFLVLVALIAFCIRCINSVLCTRVAGYLRREDIIEPKQHHEVPKSKRWKSALLDARELDVSDPESKSDVGCPSEDQAQSSSEDGFQAYGKLEEDYEKFLSECGISYSGYWRGGLDE